MDKLMSKVANYGLIILTPPLKPNFMSKYHKLIGPSNKSLSPFYILHVHTTKERGKHLVGKSSLKHGQENKILEILSSIILHHMIKNP